VYGAVPEDAAPLKVMTGLPVTTSMGLTEIVGTENA
jgi:hypothetical protein